MLDIYLIPDDDSDWEDPIESNYLTSLSLAEHSSLLPLWDLVEPAGLSIKYLKDSRLRAVAVGQLLSSTKAIEEKLDMNLEVVSSAYKKIFDALLAAEQTKGGVIAFCD